MQGFLATDPAVSGIRSLKKGGFMNSKKVSDLDYSSLYEFARCLDRAGFDAKIVGEIISSQNNTMANKMYRALTEGRVFNGRFIEIGVFDLVVPRDYSHQLSLDVFGLNHSSKFFHYNRNITDDNFARVSKKILPEERYKVRIFRVKEIISSEECLEFLESIGASLVGAQGITLAYDQFREHFPADQPIVSFDDPSRLWKSENLSMVPFVIRSKSNQIAFDLGYFENHWFNGVYFFSFCLTSAT
jgi:hypothetical protein